MPDLVTPDIVAFRRDDVVSVEVEDELVVFDEARQALHRLSPTASAIWTCLDGSGSLREIAADIADVYAAEPAQVLADVVATVRQFAEQGLLAGWGDQPEPAEEDEPGPFPSDAPAPCVGEAPQKLIVAAGPYIVGLQLGTAALAEAARTVLGPSLVTGIDTPGTLSVVATSARSGRSLYWCYRSTLIVGRHRGVRRAMQAAVGLLSSHATRESGGAKVWAMLAVRDGTAALLSSEVYAMAGSLAPLLRVSGWEVSDVPWTDLDETTGEVIVRPISVPVDDAALAALPGDPRDNDPPAPGMYPLKVWVDIEEAGQPAGTRAARVARAAGDAITTQAGTTAATLRALSVALAGAAWESCPLFEPRAVMAALHRATER